jgi:hypothetical protein
VRTTVTIDDRLFIEVKTHAAATGRTLGEVIEDALRAAMARRPAAAQVPPLPTWNGGGLQPGVDLDDSAALQDLMDESDR